MAHFSFSSFSHSRTYTKFEELAADYESGSLHPADLKPALSKAVNKILQVDTFFIQSLLQSLYNYNLINLQILLCSFALTLHFYILLLLQQHLFESDILIVDVITSIVRWLIYTINIVPTPQNNSCLWHISFLLAKNKSIINNISNLISTNTKFKILYSLVSQDAPQILFFYSSIFGILPFFVRLTQFLM